MKCDQNCLYDLVFVAGLLLEYQILCRPIKRGKVVRYKQQSKLYTNMARP